MRTPEDRYYTDVKFKALVDALAHYVYRAEYTPSEVREAAMLACIHYEHSRMRDLYLNKDMYNFAELQPVKLKD